MEQILLELGGSYRDGHFNVVAIDQRSQYPEVETVSSTGIKPTKEKVKKIFAHHGNPRRICTDNGPSFNSKEFSDFAQEEGFVHPKVTPGHPRANGLAETFMQTLNKTGQITRQGTDWF